MANAAFAVLLADLNSTAATSRSELIRALYLIRAHRSLAGIIPIANRLTDLALANPGLLSLIESHDGGHSLELLRRIGALRSNDAGLQGYALGDNNPLKPLSGDSCISDLLLLEPSCGQRLNNEWESILVWFIYQAIRFQLTGLSLATYRRYLLDEFSRLREIGAGHRLYNVFLRIRWLADPTYQDQLTHIVELNLGLDADTSRSMAIASRAATLSRNHRERLREHVHQQFGEGIYEAALAAFPRHRRLDGVLALFLSTVYLPQFVVGQAARGGGGGGRITHRPNVRRTRYLTAATEILVADGVNSGTVIDIHPRLPLDPSDEELRDDEDDDPDTQEHGEPAVSLYLSSSQDLIRAHYATRALQHQVEHANAMLPWTNRTLSADALAEILDLIQYKSQEDAADRLARLAIGLSLVSGRSLEAVARPLITSGEPPLTELRRVGINLETHCLVVLTARPKLRATKAVDFCHRYVSSVQLSLPDDWRPLIESLVDYEARQAPPIALRARALLQQCSPFHNVTPTGLEAFLRRQLARHSNGDIAVYKGITDRAGVNLENLMHYASIDSRQIEALWSQAVDGLGLARPTRQACGPRGRVGAIQAFNIVEVAGHIHSIRQRLLEADAARDFVRAYNLYTLYIAQWMGLATAGRKTRHPLPQVIVGGNQRWALIQDKSRHDGSTDRLIPLTNNLWTQVCSYLAYASSLSVLEPRLEPLLETDGGVQIQLRYITAAGEVIDYRPKFQEANEKLPALPANWLRKLVRSESSKLPGRYRDAGLGHWVRGRNPWRATSSFDPVDYGEQWLGLQHWLESELGFQPVELSPGETIRRAPQANLVRKSKVSAQSTHTPAPSRTDETIDQILANTDAGLFQATFGPEPDGGSALDLVRRAVCDLQLGNDAEGRARLAEELCERIRSKTKIPLFAARPRRRFSRDWQLDSDGLRALAVFEREIEPAFRRDLERLPEPDDSEAGQLVDLGRWIMIAIWRLGLTHWPLIVECSRRLARDPSLLAAGDLRYLCINVPHAGTREPMPRTIVFDDCTTVYWIAEHRRLTPLLESLTAQSAQRRRARAERALSRYLRQLGVDTPLKLTPMTAAATQSLMLRAGPLVAAYAAGRLYTADLADTDLRRLAGLAPNRNRGDQNDAPTYLLFDESPGPGLEELPADLRQQSAHWFNKLVRRKSSIKREWLRAISDVVPANEIGRLLRGYAIWLVRRSLEDGPAARFTKHERNQLVSRLQIVGHALYGYADTSAELHRIDEDTLESLQELGAENFPERAHNGAWYRFHAFLRDPDADKGGVEVGRLGANFEHAVSARIVSAAEQTQIAATLRSTRSNIGNAQRRRTAYRVFDMVRAFGLRRSEAERIREVDHQENLVWIQPYEGHGLKTAWACRCLPVKFAPEATQAWLTKRADERHGGHLVQETTGAGLDNAIYDQINRTIKLVTGDQNLGLHHLRHTVASQLTLTLMAEGVGLDRLFRDVTWLEPLLIGSEHISSLLDGEPDGGQGLQAVSALLGHSHPTTTVRHYVHVCFLLLHAAQRRDADLNMARSFEARIASLSSVQRWAKAAREQASAAGHHDSAAWIARVMRSYVEDYDGAVIDRDDRPVEPGVRVDERALESCHASAGIHFDAIEAIDRSLRTGEVAAPSNDLAKARAGLRRLAALPTGKRGSNVQRHPMESIGEQPMPAALAAGTATRAAVVLCEWLENMHAKHPDDFQWVLHKWRFDSESERGRMRLNGKAEVCRAEALATTDMVVIEVQTAPQPKKRAKATDGVPRMRIRCRDDDGRPLRRDTGAVRWVLSYISALW
ncbi:MAG: hypothetical protein RJQ08_14730 [Salinisphaeraceae bacterium]